MAGAYQHMPGVLRPTHFRVGRVILFAVIGLGALVAAGLAYMHWQGGLPGKIDAQPVAEWIPPQRVSYTPEPPPPAPPPPHTEDPMAERWAALQRQLAQMQNDIAALKNRPQPQAAAADAPQSPHRRNMPKMLYVKHPPKDAPTSSSQDLYLSASSNEDRLPSRNGDELRRGRHVHGQDDHARV